MTGIRVFNTFFFIKNIKGVTYLQLLAEIHEQSLSISWLIHHTSCPADTEVLVIFTR